MAISLAKFYIYFKYEIKRLCIISNLDTIKSLLDKTISN